MNIGDISKSPPKSMADPRDMINNCELNVDIWSFERGASSANFLY